MLNPIYYAEIKSDFSMPVGEMMDGNFSFMHLLGKLYYDASLGII